MHWRNAIFSNLFPEENQLLLWSIAQGYHPFKVDCLFKAITSHLLFQFIDHPIVSNSYGALLVPYTPAYSFILGMHPFFILANTFLPLARLFFTGTTFFAGATFFARASKKSGASEESRASKEKPRQRKKVTPAKKSSASKKSRARRKKIVPKVRKKVFARIKKRLHPQYEAVRTRVWH